MAASEALAALADQIEELRGAIARLHATVAKWDERLDGGIGEMMVLRVEVKHLTEALDEALARHRLKPPPAPYWVGLDGAEQRERLAELQTWVEGFLRVHYPDYTSSLRACWVNHPEAVWELSTLMTEWGRVYGDEDEDNRDLSAALWWHERWLPGSLTRLVKAIRCDEAGCRRARRLESGP
jgi:regulator of replication initiation timing